MSDEQEQVADQGWASLDGLAQVRRAKAEVAAAASAIDDTLAAPFLSDAGKRMLEHLVDRILNRPSWNLGDTIETAHFREGQKDIVSQLVAAVNRVKTRTAAGGTSKA